MIASGGWLSHSTPIVKLVCAMSLLWAVTTSVAHAQNLERDDAPAQNPDKFDPDLPDVALVGPISIHTLLQVRYAATFAEASRNPRPGYAVSEDIIVHDNDGFRLRRMYLRLLVNPVDWFSSKLVLNFAKFASGSVEYVVRQAYIGVAPVPDHVEFTAGLLQLPFSLMKLTSASRLEVADKGPTSDLATEQGFAGRDLGVSVRVSPLEKRKRLRLTLGAYRGHARDEHASPLGLLGARLTFKPIKGLELGSGVMHHLFDARYKRPFETSDKQELPLPPDPLYPHEKTWSKGTAWGIDASFEHDKRLLVRAEGMWGDRVDADERYGARAFFGAFALISYRFQVGPITLQPALRGEWSDADLDHDVGTRRVYTIAMHVILDQHVRVLLDVIHVDAENSTPVINSPRPLPATPYFELDHTRALCQLQVEI